MTHEILHEELEILLPYLQTSKILSIFFQLLRLKISLFLSITL